MQAIDAQGISKAFKSLQALRDVCFQVPQNTVFCILGPNGAGKTTLIRILTTVSRPDSGDAYILGHSILHQSLAVRSLIGVVAQENRFDRYLTIWHNLSLHAQTHGLHRYEYEPRIQSLLEKVGLYDRRFSLTDELSGGMQRRIALVRALIHQPKILFMDEPTTGLDPQARLEIWKTIEDIKQSSTVILTTHYMEEAERLSDRLLMLNHGQVILNGTAKDLKQTLSPLNQYELELNPPKASDYAALFEAGRAGDHQGPVKIDVLDNHRLRIHVAHADDLKRLLELLEPSDLFRIGQIEADLEDVFMAVASSPQVVTGKAG